MFTRLFSPTSFFNVILIMFYLILVQILLVTEVSASIFEKKNRSPEINMCSVQEEAQYPTISPEEVLPEGEKKDKGIVTEVPDHITIKFAVVETAKAPLLEI